MRILEPTTYWGQSPSFSIRCADLKPDLNGAEVKVGLRALRCRYETGYFKAF